MSLIKSENRKKTEYVLNMKPVLDQKSFFSDGTEFYRCPQEPGAGEEVRIRFRTKRNNVDGVEIVFDHVQDKNINGKSVIEKNAGDQYAGDKNILEKVKIPMEVAFSHNGFDYYEIKVIMPDKVLRYHFEIKYGWSTCYYNARGVGMEPEPRMDFEIYPGYSSPSWAKGAVMYQIFVDRFYNGDPQNDVENREYYYIGDTTVKVEDWNKIPAAMGVREFYGGDLQGVMDKLDYLQDLGIEVIYLNPIFVSPSNHKYDIQDYDYVDPHFGKIVEDADGVLPEGDTRNYDSPKYLKRVTDLDNLQAGNELFARLCEEIHRRGMKIILDGVFNHCGSFNKWMDREKIYAGREGFLPGAYLSADSPYRSFFQFDDPAGWPDNSSYDGWWGHNTLPKLNYEASPALVEKIMQVGEKWASAPYHIDGWRLDVAADLGHSNEFNHRFWREFRRRVKAVNPDIMILAEHYGNPEGWLMGDEWDTVMNYDAFMEPVTWFLTGMEKHSDEYREELLGNSQAFIDAMKTHMRALHMSALTTAMNELSNHDHSRFLTRTSHRVGRLSYLGGKAASENVNPAVMREAVALQMTWPGSPTIYYGDEAGVCGFTDPDNRRTYPWGHEDRQMIEFHRAMIGIHKRYPVLRDGSLEFLWNDYQGLSYGRFNEQERVIVILNNQEEEREVEIEVWRTGISTQKETILERIMLSDAHRFTEEKAYHTVHAGVLQFRVQGFCAMILYSKEDDRDL